MAAAKSDWFAANKVIPTLLSLLLAAVIFIFLMLKTDVDELKKDSKDMLKQANETRLDLVKAINAVERQAASTNAKLDQLIAEGQRRR